MGTNNSHHTARAGFQVMLGNPPFLNQLESVTANEQRVAAMLRFTSGGTSKGYADLSATFLRHAMTLTGHDGRVAMVQPQPFLATTSGKTIRDSLLDLGVLTHLWISNEHVFESAQVYTCAPTLARKDDDIMEVHRTTRGSFEVLPPAAIHRERLRSSDTWSPLAAAALGIPEIPVAEFATVARMADATADFRDQYYGLDGFIVEDAAVPAEVESREAKYPRLVTTGLVDLGRLLWGSQGTRVLKTRWEAPRVDRDRMRLEGTLADWMDARIRPKVLMATQTRVLEVYTDAEGELLPSIPLITITPHDPADLWLVAAALASPVTTAVAMERYSGAAMSADALKLSAKQVLRLPLPRESDHWRMAADQLRRIQECGGEPDRTDFRQFGESAVRSYGLQGDLARQTLDWWLGRIFGVE